MKQWAMIKKPNIVDTITARINYETITEKNVWWMQGFVCHYLEVFARDSY